MPQIEALRHTLRELAAHADEVQLSEFSELSLASPTEDTISSHNLGFSRTTENTSLSSQSSGSSDHSFGSPLGFLQAALPDVPTSTLKEALKEAEREGRVMDMWDIVGGILSAESIRELEERGLDALDDEDGIFREEDVEWEVVSPKTRKTHQPSAKKRKQSRPTKIALVDIRQQNHVQPQNKKSNPSPKIPLPDLWTQVSSIATHVASYLPPHPSSFFLSYLHNPNYETPYLALCAALEALGNADSRDSSDDVEILVNLLDILLPEYDRLDSEQHLRLIYEIELCIRATKGRGDDVIDIVKLLRELNTDSSSGRWELGVYHLPPPQSPTSPTSPTIRFKTPDNRLSLPPISPYAVKLPLKPPAPTSPVASMSQGNKPGQYEWQSVPVRKIFDDVPHPLAQSIPAYARGVNGSKLKGSGNGYGKGGKGDVGELSASQGRMAEHRRRQEEYLRQASKMWQRGDKKSHRGEIALYYAEKVGGIFQCWDM